MKAISLLVVYNRNFPCLDKCRVIGFCFSLLLVKTISNIDYKMSTDDGVLPLPILSNYIKHQNLTRKLTTKLKQFSNNNRSVSSWWLMIGLFVVVMIKMLLLYFPTSSKCNFMLSSSSGYSRLDSAWRSRASVILDYFQFGAALQTIKIRSINLFSEMGIISMSGQCSFGKIKRRKKL